jgi:hypothetical protein
MSRRIRKKTHKISLPLRWQKMGVTRVKIYSGCGLTEKEAERLGLRDLEEARELGFFSERPGR